MAAPDALADALARQDVLVLDGAMGTEFERRGLDLSDALWSARVLLDSPEAIFEVHHDYLAAGADVIVSASYQACVEGFAAHGLDEAQARGLIARSVEIARQARDAFWAALPEPERARRLRPIVAGGLGPFGALLADGSEFRGDYPMDGARLTQHHRPRIEALIQGGAELLAIETLPARREAEVLADLLERDFPGVAAWFSFSARDGERLSDGEPAGAAAASLGARPCVAAIGINCTAPRFIAPLVQAMAARTDKPILAYPNRGGDWDAGRRAWGEPAAQDIATLAPAWRAAGARLIGGCCRTGPADIARLRAALTTKGAA